MPSSKDDCERLALVLRHVLDEHPAILRADDLVRELSDSPGDFAADDHLRVAVRQLVRSGLLCEWGAFVIPTRQACLHDQIAAYMV